MASPELPEFDDSLMPSEEPVHLADIVLDARHLAYARQRWPDASERMQQYRVRQTIWVRFQHRKPHPDDPGRRMVGGPQPGSGRRPTKAIGAAVVEAFEGRQKEVIDAIASALDPKEDAAVRHKAGMNIVKHAREERKDDREADEYARRTDDEIRRDMAAVFAEMIRSGEIKAADIIEGTFVEVDEEQQQIAS